MPNDGYAWGSPREWTQRARNGWGVQHEPGTASSLSHERTLADSRRLPQVKSSQVVALTGGRETVTVTDTYPVLA